MLTLMKENATIVVAVIGAAVSIFTLVLGKIYEKKLELRKIKEEQYISFLCNLAKFKVDEFDKEASIDLSQRTQTIFLTGNRKVQKALQDYLFTLHDELKIPQEIVYGKLIQAMKLDLYGRKYLILPKKYVSLNNIKLFTFREEISAEDHLCTSTTKNH